MSASQSSRANPKPIAAPAWMTSSLTAASGAIPGSSDGRSEDASILIVLLSFLAPSTEIPLDLLFRGAMPRRRWDARGEIDDMDAVHAGLAPEIASLLSDVPRLSNAFHELDLSSAISKNSDQTYMFSESAANRVRKSLPSEHLSFWRCQALVVAYRAVPWQYIESSIPNAKLFLPHLTHSLQSFQGDFEHLPPITRPDLVLTLVEASRFPNMDWKHFAIDQARTVMQGFENQYLRARLAQAKCLLSRVAGDVDGSISALGSLVQDGPSNPTDRRMYSTMGLTAVQHALNYIQVENLSMAEKSLDDWIPASPNTSPLDDVVLFRKHMILGRILRFGGRFEESLVHLGKSRNIVEQHEDLIFERDLRDLTCDLADTLRELDQPLSAERHLRKEITCRDPSCSPFPGKSLLELSLAEALFAQGRFNEAEGLCSGIQSRPNLTKFERLRLCTILAKLHHINSDDEGELLQWSNAMVAVNQFPCETGGTTRIITKSIYEILRRQESRSDRKQLLDQFEKRVRDLDEQARSGSMLYWIAGLRHWLEYLESSRARL